MTVHLLAVHLVTGLPLCCGRTAPKFSEEEGSYASCFYCWFLESFKSCLLLPMALPSLIDTLVQLLAWRSMLWLSMTMWQQKYLTQNDFLSMHNMDCWPDLWHYICFVSVRRSLPLWWKEIHAHKHTHTHSAEATLLCNFT